MENETTHSCLDCKYYKKLYVKDNCRFRVYGTGVCCHYNYKLADRRKPFPYRFACNLWEINDSTDNERMEAIEDVIRCTSKALNDILDVLKNP